MFLYVFVLVHLSSISSAYFRSPVLQALERARGPKGVEEELQDERFPPAFQSENAISSE